MIEMTLAAAASAVSAVLHGADRPFSGVSTDTRTLAAGELFVALKGDRFDAHDHLAEAAAQGAAGALVARRQPVDIAQLEVADTRLALGRLAAVWRARFAVPCVAVTGSNGKTTTKELLAAILRRQGAVLVTEGNLNNDIGVPQTLFRLGAGHRCAVIEMGANHAGEIAYLCTLARPDVALVTMAGPAHLEGFGSLGGVARAKGEIFQGLAGRGTAVVNADDAHAPLWRGLAAAARILDFGFASGAAVRAEDLVQRPLGEGSTFTLVTPEGRAPIALPLDGRHNVMNALAAAAAAVALGVPLAEIAAGLASCAGVKGRLQLKTGVNGLVVVDDTYNANPASLEAALAVLALRPGRRWLLLGDMGELGPDGAELHREAGRIAKRLGIERLLTLGELSTLADETFGAGAAHFASCEEAIAAIRESAAPDVTLLVKGSRFMRLERVVAALDAREHRAC
jgi:UDP-N-acetylmuramoyl-tripeptide--D-alanyl-D-alanine ligase